MARARRTQQKQVGTPSGKRTKCVQCPQCLRMINRQADLQRHMRTHDPRARRVPCDFARQGCRRTFLQVSNMKSHVNCVHTKAIVYTCELCNMTTYCQSSLSRHDCVSKPPCRKRKRSEADLEEDVKLEEPEQKKSHYDIPQAPPEIPTFQELEVPVEVPEIPQPRVEEPQQEPFVTEVPQPVFEESSLIPDVTFDQPQAPLYLISETLPRAYAPSRGILTIAAMQYFMSELQFLAIADVRDLIPLSLVFKSDVTMHDTEVFWYWFIQFFRTLNMDVYGSILRGDAFYDTDIQGVIMGVLVQAEWATLNTFLLLDQASGGSPHAPQSYYDHSISSTPSPTWSTSSTASSSVESLFLDKPIEYSFLDIKAKLTQESGVELRRSSHHFGLVR